MRRIFTILLAALTVSIFYGETAIKGYLVDVSCSARRIWKPGSIVGHSRGCLRMPLCEQSGYGILTDDNQFIKFDQDGNERAKKLIADMAKDTDIKIIVNGAVGGDRMTVSK